MLSEIIAGFPNITKLNVGCVAVVPLLILRRASHPCSRARYRGRHSRCEIASTPPLSDGAGSCRGDGSWLSLHMEVRRLSVYVIKCWGGWWTFEVSTLLSRHPTAALGLVSACVE